MVKKLISIVIPAYNEQGNIARLHKELWAHLPKQYLYELIFVDDGSSDKTLTEIKKLVKHDKTIKYLSLTRNFGHQNALKAGLDYGKGQAVISLDADLQHPPEAIPKMLKKWESGSKIVYGVREKDAKLPFFKSWTSRLFYQFINLMSMTKISAGAADFRLLDREVVNVIKESSETTLFLRGLVAWTGFESSSIEYKQGPREWGKSKYSLGKMLHLATDAITSFSTVPLKLATYIGLLMSLFSGVYAIYAIIVFFTNRQHVIIGWPSVIISVLFIGGLQLMILGIIGEYIGKIFLESKKRKLYLVKETNL